LNSSLETAEDKLKILKEARAREQRENKKKVDELQDQVSSLKAEL
jgi:hypothetical protein